MRYAILGTGIVGRTLASKLASLDHEVVIGTRDPRVTATRAESGGYGIVPFAEWQTAHPQISLASFSEAAADADVIVNATSGRVSVAALTEAGENNLAGKLLIDVANPLDFSHGMPPTLDPANTDSLGEQIQRAFPEAKVVKTLHTMNSQIMVEPTRVPGEHNVFIGGDDADAKAQAAALLGEIGWSPASIIDLGDITSARATEMMLPMWLRLWGTLGHPDYNFHIQGA
jgi:predicted dinucleotide-binding enzyme